MCYYSTNLKLKNSSSSFLRSLKDGIWVDYYCKDKAWVEAKIISISDLEVVLRYKNRKQESIHSKDIFGENAKLKPFRSKVKGSLHNPSINIDAVSIGIFCDFFDFEFNEWRTGNVFGINREMKEIEVERGDRKYFYHLLSKFIMFPFDISFFLNPENRINQSFNLTSSSEYNEESFKNLLKINNNWSIIPIVGDGNCLFRAVSHQLYQTEKKHFFIRQKCVDFIEARKEFFKHYVIDSGSEDNFKLYCDRMRRDGVWGDHIELQALSELYDVSVKVFEYSLQPIKIYKSERKKPPIKLSYHKKSHYNSIAPLEALLNTPVGQKETNSISKALLSTETALKDTLWKSDVEMTEKDSLSAAIAFSQKEFKNSIPKEVRRCVEDFGLELNECQRAYNELNSAASDSEELVNLIVSFVISGR